MRLLKRFGKGAAIGIAPLIPGVSAATIALIVGLYERLITEISESLSYPPNLKRDWGLLVPVTMGAALAMLAGILTIPSLIENHPLALFSFYTGLIGASAIMLRRSVQGSFAYIIIGTIIGMIISSAPIESGSETTIGTMIAGALAISAMLVPGVSGSYVLMLLGYYTFVLEALASLDLAFLTLFGIGGIIGAIITLKSIRTLFKNHHDTTMMILIGIIIGAIGTPLNQAIGSVSATSDTIALVGWLITGAIITSLIARAR